jgi:putative ABC transport system permease protein
MIKWLRTFSWQEWRHHPWRGTAAMVAVMLGVALAWAVQLINASALAEFAGAASAIEGRPDLTLRAGSGTLDDAWLARLEADAQVTLASPVLEWPTALRAPNTEVPVPVRVLGVDALAVGAVTPALAPRVAEGGDRLDVFAADAVFLNPAAQRLLGAGTHEVRVQAGLHWRTLRVAGTTGAPGGPLLVMDVAAAQALSGWVGQLSRIDLRLAPGTDAAALPARLGLPEHWVVQPPEAGGARIGQLSRAYRVNLTALALVALFTGAFLVFSVMALSVARRLPQFALLGVLGLSARERQRLVLAEAAVLGAVGSAAGVALGSVLAALALRLLGGDLGGGYFGGGDTPPALHWSAGQALLFGLLGVAAALAGAWWPARTSRDLQPAQALKGLGLVAATGRRRASRAALLLAASGVLALLPPVVGIPLPAYAAIGLLLVGGITALPLLTGVVLDHLAPWLTHRVVPLLAIERARRERHGAAVATSGVVASLALSVALTVMVASFRDSVVHWLDAVLPAQLYVRSSDTSVGEGNPLPADFVAEVAALPGIVRADPQRATRVLIDPDWPPVVLLARPLDVDGRGRGQALPLLAPALPVPATGPAGEHAVAVYVSEATAELHGVRPGQWFTALARALAPREPTAFFVAGTWRDYARQHGSVAIDLDDWRRASGDGRVNELALHLAEGTDEDTLRGAIRAAAARHGNADLLAFASAAELRATSLRIFDRSFAVTWWLQAVAIGIGLFGVANSFSAQVLVRRREFGLLAHLGLTRRQVLQVVATEGLAWTTLGALAGLVLGVLVSAILIHVVNPQSFHWTMDMRLPAAPLAVLFAAVVLTGTAAAWLAGRAAAGHDVVQAVKEDW